ncbi:hypothetical protein GLU64_01640 [Nanohaloarchaea archaeon]|nr:hypothetical protein [Candidatus Nanohaloarchaea archaeon]
MGSVNLLEKNLEKILDLAGFDPRVRTKLEGYEIDVLLEYKSIQAIFECKQYQKGSLTVRNLIHEWTGKNEEIGADRVILVLVGVSVTDEDYELAEKRDITIWEGEKIDELLNKAVEDDENIKEEILSEAGLESTEEIQNRIEEMHDKYHVSRSTVKEYLRGDITKEKLEELSVRSRKVDEKIKKIKENCSEKSKGLNGDIKSILSREDKKKLIEGGMYRNTDFSDIVEFMIENGISHKKLAHNYLNEEGSINGENYTKADIEKIDMMVENLDCSVDEADGTYYGLTSSDGYKTMINFSGKRPREKFLERCLDVINERDDLDYHEVENLFLEGYSVRQLKNEEEKDIRMEPEIEDPLGCFEIDRIYEKDKKDETYLAKCPNCGEDGIIDLSREEIGDTSECWNCEKSYKIDVSNGFEMFEEAQALVENDGGVWNGREYSSDAIDKAKFIADKFNFPIEESFKILENMKRRRDGEYPEKKFLRKTSKVKPERKHLSFHEIKEYFDEGYTVDDLINEKDKENERSDDKACNKKDEENQDKSEEQEKDDAQGRDFNNLDNFIVKEEDKKRPDYTHILICPDCKSEIPIDITQYGKGSRPRCEECGSWHSIENIQQYQDYEKKKITINPRSNQQTASFDCPYCGKDLIERAPNPGNREKITCEECNEYFVVESKGNKEPEDTSAKGFFKSIGDILRG